MSISDNYIPLRQLGNGVTTQFSAVWDVIALEYLFVYLEDSTTGVQTLQMLGVDYTATFDNSGVTVIFTTAPLNTQYAVVTRQVKLDQTNPYKTSKGFQGNVIEDSLDKLTAITQDLSDITSRTLVFNPGTMLTGQLPTPIDDAILAWDGIIGKVKNGPTTASLANAANAAAASAIAAAASATSAQASATVALNAALSLMGTSTTSNTIGAGAHTFTTQSGKLFVSGTYVVITSSASPTTTNMFGIVTSYSGTLLIVNVIIANGTGAHADWNITVSGAQGAQGATGPAGSGSGDMLRANNLSDLTNIATARANLGLDTASQHAIGFFLQTANNLSDVVSAATALGNLGGLSTSAASATYLTQTTAASTYQPINQPALISPFNVGSIIMGKTGLGGSAGTVFSAASVSCTAADGTNTNDTLTGTWKMLQTATSGFKIVLFQRIT